MQAKVGPDAGLLELAANFERALNYMHTGSGKCLVRGTMHPSWLTRTLLSDGCPSVNSAIINIVAEPNNVSITLNYDAWPHHPDTDIPISAAKASVLFYYNNDMWNVSHTTDRQISLKLPETSIRR